MERIIKGTDGSDNATISYQEARDIEDGLLADVLYYVKTIVDEATKDEEERSNLEIHMARKLGAFRNACVMRGILMDPESYLRELGLPEKLGGSVTIEEVEK